MSDVYPNLDRLERCLGLAADEKLATVKKVEIEGDLLRGLLDLILADFALDERKYQSDHGLGAELDWGSADTVSEHFATIGYFAGLTAAPRNFDAQWYLETYPEARIAIREGRFQTALEHYLAEGQRQSRSPNGKALEAQARWRDVLGGVESDVPIKLAPESRQRARKSDE